MVELNSRFDGRLAFIRKERQLSQLGAAPKIFQNIGQGDTLFCSVKVIDMKSLYVRTLPHKIAERYIALKSAMLLIRIDATLTNIIGRQQGPRHCGSERGLYSSAMIDPHVNDSSLGHALLMNCPMASTFSCPVIVFKLNFLTFWAKRDSTPCQLLQVSSGVLDFDRA